MSVVKNEKMLLLTAAVTASAALPCSAGTTNAIVALAEGAGIPLEDAVGIGIASVYGVLGFLSIVALALVLYLIAVLRRSQIAPASLRSELKEKILTGNLDEARRLCRFHASPLSSVVLAALDHLHDVPTEDSILLRDIVEAEGARQSESIQGQTQYLMDVAVVSPMLGLLGTVFGMMLAFNAVAGQIAVVRPTELVAGVNKAMITTAFGLIVGIPSMMFFAYFRRRASKMVAILELASADLFTALLSGRTSK